MQNDKRTLQTPRTPDTRFCTGSVIGEKADDGRVPVETYKLTVRAGQMDRKTNRSHELHPSKVSNKRQIYTLGRVTMDLFSLRAAVVTRTCEIRGAEIKKNTEVIIVIIKTGHTAGRRVQVAAVVAATSQRPWASALGWEKENLKKETFVSFVVFEFLVALTIKTLLTFNRSSLITHSEETIAVITFNR